MTRILVTGGAGFIGSHTVDALVQRGYEVRVLDNLEQPTHPPDANVRVAEGAEFHRGDVRNLDDLARALRDVDAVLHLAATGGFRPQIARYFETNTLGTANLLELIQQKRYRVRKLVVASSVGIYGEGQYQCETDGLQAPEIRPVRQLESQRWEPICPVCGCDLEPIATPEAKLPRPQNAYSISKFDQERLVLSFGQNCEVPAYALRYFLTYGPRQSLSNPYTGVVSIFTSRILNGMAPVLFEDGRQMRDFVHVEDVVSANILALEREDAPYGVFNVGTGSPTSINQVARSLCELLGRQDLAPEVSGEYRPGEARHIFADIAKLRSLTYEPKISLRDGLSAWLSWIQQQSGIDEYWSQALVGLRRSGVVRRPGATVEADSEEESTDDGLSVIIPAYNEAGNLESVVGCVASDLSGLVDDLEILIVNDGSGDGTKLIAEQLAASDERVRVVHHPYNAGYGGAMRTGFRHVTKEWVVVIPADHQFRISDLARFLEVRDGADIIGSVRTPRGDTWRRRLVSRVYNAYLRARYGVRLKDVNWVKMWRRSILSEFDIESLGFAIDAELVVKAMHLGFRITEVRVDHHPRTWGSETGINSRNVISTLRELRRLPGMLEQMKRKKGQ